MSLFSALRCQQPHSNSGSWGQTACAFLALIALAAATRGRYGWDNITDKHLFRWRHRCYGRNDDSWDPHFVLNGYSGRRVALAPPPGPPPPVAPGALSLSILPGRLVEPALFGWCMEEWGLILNLTYNDTAGMALTAALHPGVLRCKGTARQRPAPLFTTHSQPVVAPPGAVLADWVLPTPQILAARAATCGIHRQATISRRLRLHLGTTSGRLSTLSSTISPQARSLQRLLSPGSAASPRPLFGI